MCKVVWHKQSDSTFLDTLGKIDNKNELLEIFCLKCFEYQATGEGKFLCWTLEG